MYCVKYTGATKGKYFKEYPFFIITKYQPKPGMVWEGIQSSFNYHSYPFGSRVFIELVWCVKYQLWQINHSTNKDIICLGSSPNISDVYILFIQESKKVGLFPKQKAKQEQWHKWIYDFWQTQVRYEEE